MSVVNAYVEANIAAGKLTAAAQSRGGETLRSVITFETAAADDAGSKYRLIKGINPDMIITDIRIYNDALSGATDVDMGLYETLDDNGNGGAAISASVTNCYADALNLSSANPVNSPEYGMEDLDVANIVKRVYEVAGHTQSTKKRSYDLVMTMNSEIAAAGTITVIVDMVQG